MNPRPAAPPDHTTPFTWAQFRDTGGSREKLRRLRRAGAVRCVVHSVYVSTSVADTVALRLAALRLVVPPDAVVVDETAAWAHGVDVLEPGAHLVVPPVHVFVREPGRRLRNGLTASGERRLAVTDVEVVDAIAVTTPLRTACDLGRLRHADRGMAAIDALLRLDRFAVEHLLGELDRFKGFRGVVQLRVLAPLADGGAESPAESALRLRWYDAGLPAPVTQYVVPGPAGTTYRLDLALPGVRLAVEYDGEAFHTSPEARLRDERRRRWITEVLGWTLVVLTRSDIYGTRQTASVAIRQAFQDVTAA